MRPDPEGQAAVTEWRVLGRGGDGTSWLECRPRTGRTHQIRVHLAELGCPILGDPVYGRRDGGAPPMVAPLQLHARSVSLPLYPARPPVGAVAPAPPRMLEALARCGYGPPPVTAVAGG
jgi:23S rRNA-/tRNA-specific pseudouridylate synthase